MIGCLVAASLLCLEEASGGSDEYTCGRYTCVARYGKVLQPQVYSASLKQSSDLTPPPTSLNHLFSEFIILRLFL